MASNEAANELNDAIERLWPVMKAKGKNMAIFLHQMINVNADDESVHAIAAAVDRYRDHLESGGK